MVTYFGKWVIQSNDIPGRGRVVSCKEKMGVKNLGRNLGMWLGCTSTVYAEM